MIMSYKDNTAEEKLLEFACCDSKRAADTGEEGKCNGLFS